MKLLLLLLLGGFAMPHAEPMKAHAEPMKKKTQVMLTWTASTTPTVSRQYVYRATRSGGQDYSHPLVVINSNTTVSYLDTDPHLQSKTTYFYTIKAYDNGTFSAPSNEFSITIK